MSLPPRTGLLVSVRSVAEAEAALAGGADLIDVKEPSRGSLGRADDDVLAAVVRAVAGRRPVSAAMGELRAANQDSLPAGPCFLKWGLAGLGGASDRWQRRLLACLRGGRARGVAVAYADWRRADAPAPAIVCDFACRASFGAVLLDTYAKDGSTLLDWLSVAEVAELCRRCRGAGLPIALAGSLGPREIMALLHLQPAWFAVRGAACAGGRNGSIAVAKVHQLANLLAQPIAVTHGEN